MFVFPVPTLVCIIFFLSGFFFSFSFFFFVHFLFVLAFDRTTNGMACPMWVKIMYFSVYRIRRTASINALDHLFDIYILFFFLDQTICSNRYSSGPIQSNSKIEQWNEFRTLFFLFISFFPFLFHYNAHNWLKTSQTTTTSLKLIKKCQYIFVFSCNLHIFSKETRNLHGIVGSHFNCFHGYS